jgi:hypothetical protein
MREEENVDTPTAWAYWNSTERDVNENRKKDRIFAARMLIGLDNHRVCMYTPDLFVSNQKETRQRRLPILSDLTEFLAC